MIGSFKATPLYTHEGKSVALIELDGTNNVVINLDSDTTYEVLDGSGSFQIIYDQTTWEERTVKPGDVVRVPKGASYQDIGNLVMLATCEPPLNPDAVVTIWSVV